MSADPRGPVEIVKQGDNYFREWRPGCDSNWLYLRGGETDWHGPFPTSGYWATEQRHEHQHALRLASRLGSAGLPVHVQIVGAYIRTRVLFQGPAKKLSDWKQMLVGATMLIHPDPDSDDVERGHTRVRYMRHKGLGNYRTWTDAAGALWVERL